MDASSLLDKMSVAVRGGDLQCGGAWRCVAVRGGDPQCGGASRGARNLACDRLRLDRIDAARRRIRISKRQVSWTSGFRHRSISPGQISSCVLDRSPRGWEEQITKLVVLVVPTIAVVLGLVRKPILQACPET